MPLRIAFDLDGVLADMEGELTHHAELLFGDAMTRRVLEGGSHAQDAGAEVSPAEKQVDNDTVPPTVTLKITRRQQRRLWRHVGTIENFWETLDELEPGAIARLAAIVIERRWEIIFLTKRPESAGATAQMQTQRWLESKGFTLPSVYVVQGSRGRIAAALGLDVVIDDRPENCLDVILDSNARAILVWRSDETQLPAATKRLGIGVVASIDECLDILRQVDSTPAGKPSAMNRVMQRLGLTEPATPEIHGDGEGRGQ